ncbi:hypothetical protein BDV93DRAFT_553168 [Ceratobasidium sp. AG-I]|nr:hypothetical protein BDV93DRAFT_553168 [Ceratobasidium sp. AG-I]
MPFDQSTFDNASPDTQHLCYPNLQGLRLFRCEITSPALRSLVNTHRLRWLKLNRCLFSLDTDQAEEDKQGEDEQEEDEQEYDEEEEDGRGFMAKCPESLVEWLNVHIPEFEPAIDYDLPYAYGRTLP